MDKLLEFIYLYPELVGLTLAIIAEWLMPFPAKYSPASFFRLLADGFAKKLATSGSEKQQTLSGWLSLITYLFLLLAILFALLFVAENDVWTHALLLYLSLGYQPVANRTLAINQCVDHNQKSAAKSLLAQHCPYDVNRLSLFGVNKLSIEMASIYFVSAWLMPALLFIVFNGVAAFAYRAVFEAYLCWLPQSPTTRYYGKGVTAVKNTIEILPTYFFAPIYSVFSSSPGWSRLIRNTKVKWQESKASNNNLLVWLSIVAAGCKSEMAGPLMISDRKIVRPRINSQSDKTLSQPNKTMIHLLNWNNRFRFTVVLFNMAILFALIFTSKG
ncbi:MAG: cobalamin biosynthesis protein [Gammaproteobacteria bacterium]|nr:cobalamin biosynthesis protein [Gammaproteobacteria bacterium]